MPAYFDTGFSVRMPAWHGEGLVLDDYPTDWADARVKAGLTWEPAVRPAYTLVNAANIGDRPVIYTFGPDSPVEMVGKAIIEDVEHRTIVRDDTEAILGQGVSDDFTPVPNGALGEIMEALLDADGNVKFETAGSCKGGANVWALAYLDEPIIVAGDDTETYPFLAITNAHDGSGALKCNFTDIRIVCWNTYQAAQMQGERSGRQFSFRHTGSVMDRIEDAKRALAGLRDESAEWVTLATDLATLNADDRAVEVFTQEFIPMPEADIISDRVRNNIERARATFRGLYLDSVTTTGHRGTALGLVDASVEYLDHVRGFRNRDTYLGRTILRPEPLKARAVTLARRVCQ